MDQNERLKGMLVNGNDKLQNLLSNNKLRLESSINRLDHNKGYSHNVLSSRGISPNRNKLNNNEI